jgi:hypothetical protein
LTEQLAGLSIDEMKPSAGFAIDNFLFVVSHILIIVHPVLDLHLGLWAGE